MLKSFLRAFLALLFITLPIPLRYEVTLPVPVVEAAEATIPEAPHAFPTQITIPSIKLSSPIEHMGLNEKGELDVPSGKSNRVGWYKNGSTPGEVGSAVMDAHVYAAFANLNKARIGDEILVSMSNGVTHRFKITEKKTLPYTQVPSYELFHRATDRELHLITCAGSYNKKLKTYEKRLLVYATLVK